MSVRSYKYNDKTQLTLHFNVSEFKCKCGRNHDILIDTELPVKLEQIYATLKCSKIVINSGHRCMTHDINVGGSGYGKHVDGQAVDIVCFGQNGQRISSKKVCCVAQDVGFGGIANIDSTYTATHVDTRGSNKWFGNEVVTYSYSVTTDFYSYFGIAKGSLGTVEQKPAKDNTLIKELQTILKNSGSNIAVDGIVGPQTINTAHKYTVDKGTKSEIVKWLQKILTALGYDTKGIDGVVGNNTMAAINKWQADNKLGQGYFGGTDWDKLLTQI